MKKLAFLFSGQGSQYYQMGKPLFQQRGRFYRYAMELDELMRVQLGESLVAAIYDERRRISDPFNRTVLSHPAIFLVEYALSKALISEGVQPDYVLATSMGAFAALAVAGCLTMEEAAHAVIAQARTVNEQAASGGMIALPVIPPERTRLLAAQYGCELAAINRWSPGVIAADDARLEQLEGMLMRDNVVFQRLAVSQAYHSRWLDGAQVSCVELSACLPLRRAEIPVMCSVEPQLIRDISKTYLWDAIRKPIRFDEAAERLCAHDTVRLIDVGPSGTLATALKRYAAAANAAVDSCAVLTPFDKDARRYQALVSATPAWPALSINASTL